MSWIYGYFGNQCARQRDLRPTLHSFDSPGLKIRAGGSGKNLLCFKNPHQNGELVFVLGDPILRKQDDFCYPDASDWARLCADEQRVRDLDGHWLILFASQDGIRAYNDPLCQRSLYLHQSIDSCFFASEISLLKEAGLAELDARRFGAYWHSLFPPQLRRYAASRESYYKDVKMLFQGSSLSLDANGLRIADRAFLPAEQREDLPDILEKICLLPLKAGRRVCVGLSGGMDIRALLAILLKSGLPFGTVHFGSDQGEDFRIAHQISADHKLPFRFISNDEARGGWELVRDYLYHRGFGFNPASSSLLGYFPILSEQADVFLGGYYGELFRLRFMTAHITSLFKPGKPDFKSFADYLYLNPPSIFLPEVNLELQRGFVASLKRELEDMPTSAGMPSPLWMNLFYARYSPRSINMPDLSHLDNYICDHMPFLQSSVVGQHWHYGLFQQFNEELHRAIIRQKAPQLQNYPLAIAEHSSAYRHRPFSLKLRLKLKRGKSFSQSRTELFLHDFKDQILALRNDSRVTNDAWLDQRKLDEILKAYYLGDKRSQNGLLSFISYALGK